MARITIKKFIFPVLLLFPLCVFSQNVQHKTVNLPMYEPLEEAIGILNKVLDSEHPNMPETFEGVFVIKKENNRIVIYFEKASVLNVLNENFIENYMGCSVYRDHLFIFWTESRQDSGFDQLFVESNKSMIFLAAPQLLIYYDPIWTFHRVENKYIFFGIQFSPNWLISPDMNDSEFDSLLF